MAPDAEGRSARSPGNRATGLPRQEPPPGTLPSALVLRSHLAGPAAVRVVTLTEIAARKDR